MLKNKQIKILMLMHELEKTLGDLYTLFAKKFPECNHVWSILIREEYEHAEAVQKFYQQTYAGNVFFNEGTLQPDSVQSILDYVKHVDGLAHKENFSLREALTITHGIEKSVVEKDLFRHFKVKADFGDMLRRLHDDSLNHMNLAKKALEKIAGNKKR